MQDADPHGTHTDGEHGHASEHRGFVQLFVVPIAVPAIAGIVILGAILAVSQILLAVGGDVATPIALFIALVVLLVCGYLAAKPQLSRGVLTASIAVPVIVLAVSGIGARVYRVNNPETGHKESKGTAAAAIPTQVTTDNHFSVTSYTVPANTPIDITVQNQGQAIHNMDILGVKDAVTGADIKTPSLVQPGTSQDLKFTIAQPGTYKFQCDVHPTEMIGQITVTPATGAGGAAAAATPGAPGGLSETTTDNKFSTTSLTINHGEKVTMTVDNKGQAIHNWNVLDVKSADGSVIKTDFVQPGKTASVTFQIDAPGTYNFQCDVHPTEMKGTLTVK